MAWHNEIDDIPVEDVVGMDTGTPITEATLPPAVDVGNDTVANIGNVFRQGDRDAGPNGDIRAAQTALSRLGTSVGEVDGVYGRNTMNAVQDAQEMFGLPRTGVLDQTTQDRLNNLTDDQIDFFTSETEAIAAATAEAAPATALQEASPVESETPVEEETNQTDTSTTFATIISGDSSTEVTETPPLTAGFDSLVEAEGTNIHLDGRGFVTLPYGIVPDKDSVTKADGTAFNPTGSHGLKTSDLSGVDYSNATKFGVSRTSYDTDEDFAKAVYSAFANKTATQYGEGFDELTDAAKQAAYDMAWNASVDSASWSSVQTMLTEASKEDDNTKTTDNLIGFTTNFRSGTEKVNDVIVSNHPRGLLKRRLTTYNLVAKSGEEAATITTTAVMENGERTGTQYEIKTSDGSVLKTWTKPDLNELLGDLAVE